MKKFVSTGFTQPGKAPVQRIRLARSTRSRITAAALVIITALSLTPALAAPFIVAHRGGTGDTPENTLQAFGTALENGADALWMTVQVTKDGVPVLYRPADLGSLTDGQGRLDDITLNDLRKLNAGYSFSRKDASGRVSYPYRADPLRIPTLREALDAVPPSVPIMLDMKQSLAAPLVEAVARVLDSAHAWSRVRLYSTDADAIELMKTHPEAQVFETRDATRNRLVDLSLGGTCDNPPPAGSWVGIELHRQVEVVEHFTLGTGVSKVDARWWTPAAVKCFKTNGNVKIVAFGVDSADAYATAAALGIDAVMTDSPRAMRTEKKPQ
ncbi:glycerophosphodiester phosphodiesterase [Caballeronia sp. SEWSISQ10-4 2]|uniref:glycerophosphodiester phosphodiesterase family protein n=1 Tax=Caballeronia sp. SEWSISQ10-4 2 TaxID=2937438 RepID=UPI002651AD15|nr:glycerophosphodiester phosphodiesterase family protein [Caballeronia sp. SEWSISQ10-4 2]MDN7182784.1 glycerophosphodiester phosphodiesterase [Caballeronia sp. SEWSISQ10-4 2]